MVVVIEQVVVVFFVILCLVDVGVYVIKIEWFEGDFVWGYDDVVKGQVSYFVWLNWGKDLVVLDLVMFEGKVELVWLLDGVDVLVQNLKCGVLVKLGFMFDWLVQDWLCLIICLILGYGEVGLMVDRKVYDLLIQVELGLCLIIGGLESLLWVGMLLVDIVIGVIVYVVIFEVLIQCGIIGKGVNISVLMFDVMVDWLIVLFLNYEGGKFLKWLGFVYFLILFYSVFVFKDGKQVLILV